MTSITGFTLKEHLQRLDATHTALLSALQSMTADDLRHPHTHLEYDVTPEWVFHHLMQHEAKHRGQIADLITIYRSKD